MASCRQAPGERVYEFANRLNEAVRTALSGENEETIRKRLLEEFLEKLTPELQFEVKAWRPMSYSNAYEIAQHFELLLATKRTNQVSVADSVAELSHKVEALAIHQHSVPKRGTERRVCYYCRRPGHVVKDCRDKKRDEERRGHGGRTTEEMRGNTDKGTSHPTTGRATAEIIIGHQLLMKEGNMKMSELSRQGGELDLVAKE
ncbi:hypothetical protein niasHT_031906 [Heterodera trifolii]|uniref:CCHC-type domain-containing protein n=1 Tax=Heterodera trifolii TaxID=157864 RepID=A0ABD2HUL6_9BILA